MKTIIKYDGKKILIDYSTFSMQLYGELLEILKRTEDCEGKDIRINSVVDMATSAELINVKEYEATVSPLPGGIAKLFFKNGELVQSGDVVLVIESMKMEVEILAESSGLVQYLVPKGIKVKQGEPLFYIQ